MVPRFQIKQLEQKNNQAPTLHLSQHMSLLSQPPPDAPHQNSSEFSRLGQHLKGPWRTAQPTKSLNPQNIPRIAIHTTPSARRAYYRQEEKSNPLNKQTNNPREPSISRKIGPTILHRRPNATERTSQLLQKSTQTPQKYTHERKS